jgi:hypothetical protein
MAKKVTIEYQCYSHIKFTSIIRINIFISKTYIKGLYHILWKTGGRDKRRHARVHAKCDYSSFPKLFLSLNIF